MSKRTKKTKARFPKTEHARREREKRHRRYLNIRLKGAPRPNTPSFAAKVACHDALDRLWCGPDAPMNRRIAYKYLRKITGAGPDEAHVAKLSTSMCYIVVQRIKHDYPHLFTEAELQEKQPTENDRREYPRRKASQRSDSEGGCD